VFTFRPIKSWQDLADHLELWQQLHRQLTPENIFTRPFWSRAWLESHGTSRKRKVVLLTSATQGAEGVLLLSIGKSQRLKLPVVSIETIGLGRSFNRRHYVYEQEPLLTRPAINPLLACISKLKAWTFVRLAPLPENYSLSKEIITAAPTHGMIALKQPYGVGYKIKTQHGWDAYEKSRPKKFMKNIYRACRRLKSAGEFTVKSHGKGDLPEDLLGIIKTVSKNSWKVSAGSDILNPSFRGFFENIFLESLSAGYTTLWVLYQSGHPIAYEWHLNQKRRIVAIKADFDQKFAHYSPGNILAWHALKGSFESGVAEIDYLFGGGDYKQKWATDRYEMEELLLFNSSLYSRFLYKILARQDWIEFMWRLSDRFGPPKKQKRTNTCEN